MVQRCYAPVMAYAPAPPPLATARIATPIGTVTITAAADALTDVQICPGDAPDVAAPTNPLLIEAVRQLSAYFAGTLRDFDLPLAPLHSNRGMVLRAGVVAIPYGTTLTYGLLAKLLGSAPRAIGQACRRNPLPIIIPCHRVTSTAGPEYYSGGDGAATKAWLIDFEHRNVPPEHRTRLI